MLNAGPFRGGRPPLSHCWKPGLSLHAAHGRPAQGGKGPSWSQLRDGHLQRRASTAFLPEWVASPPRPPEASMRGNPPGASSLNAVSPGEAFPDPPGPDSRCPGGTGSCHVSPYCRLTRLGDSSVVGKPAISSSCGVERPAHGE